MNLFTKDKNILILNKLVPYILLITLSFYIKESQALFRFCYRGTWHELREDDCPYGLLFDDIWRIPCFYTLGQDRTAPRIWESLCDDPLVNELRNDDLKPPVDNFFLAQKNTKVEFIQYGLNESRELLNIYDDVTDINTCLELCLLSLEDEKAGSSHEEGDSEEVSDTSGSSSEENEIDDTQKMSITDQTLRLGDYLFDELNTEENNRKQSDDSIGPNLRIVNLYKKTIKILGKTCPHPFIPEDFRNRILSGFLFLVEDTGIGEVDDISVEEFEDIMGALKTCEDKYPSFRLEGTVCTMKTIVSEIIKILPDGEELSSTYKPSKWDRNLTQFPYKKYDPFVEFAWQAVTVTYASCFANFKPNANMHHKFTSAMEKLFGDKIRFRWEHPTTLEDKRMWGTWFLADVDSTYLNMGACISASYEGAPFSMKLDRPVDSTRRSGRRKRDLEDIEEKGVKIPPSVTDHLDNMQVYWDHYRDSGGVANNLYGSIQCFQYQEKRDQIIDSLKEAECEVEVTSELMSQF